MLLSILSHVFIFFPVLLPSFEKGGGTLETLFGLRGISSLLLECTDFNGIIITVMNKKTKEIFLMETGAYSS